jgi:hypothetical protein
MPTKSALLFRSSFGPRRQALVSVECRSDLSRRRGESKRHPRNRRRGAHAIAVRRALLRPLPAAHEALLRAIA